MKFRQSKVPEAAPIALFGIVLVLGVAVCLRTYSVIFGMTPEHYAQWKFIVLLVASLSGAGASMVMIKRDYLDAGRRLLEALVLLLLLVALLATAVISIFLIRFA